MLALRGHFPLLSGPAGHTEDTNCVEGANTGNLQAANCMSLTVPPNSASHETGNLLKTEQDMRYLLRVIFFFLPGKWIRCFSSVNFVDDEVLSLCQKFGHPTAWRKGLQLGGVGHEPCVHDPTGFV